MNVEKIKSIKRLINNCHDDGFIQLSLFRMDLKEMIEAVELLETMRSPIENSVTNNIECNHCGVDRSHTKFDETEVSCDYRCNHCNHITRFYKPTSLDYAQIF